MRLQKYWNIESNFYWTATLFTAHIDQITLSRWMGVRYQFVEEKSRTYAIEKFVFDDDDDAFV